MNDRYLYRAKRIYDGEWVEGSLITGVFFRLGQNILYILCPDKADYDCFEDFTEENGIFEIDPSTICQCTAVPDRDNTIMFENDVVRESNGVRGVIRFGRYGDEKTDYGFYIEWEKSQPYWRNDIYYWQNELRVIGSYIDNPELLEVGE